MMRNNFCQAEMFTIKDHHQYNTDESSTVLKCDYTSGVAADTLDHYDVINQLSQGKKKGMKPH